jgi:hypothetical protein
LGWLLCPNGPVCGWWETVTIIPEIGNRRLIPDPYSLMRYREYSVFYHSFL